MLFIKRENIKAKKTINIRQIRFECVSRMFEQKKRIKSFEIILFVLEMGLEPIRPLLIIGF